MQRLYNRWSENNKALLLSQQGFFFVAEGVEISNLRLLEDIYKILEFMASEIPLKFQL
jgi:hypothetical protein